MQISHLQLLDLVSKTKRSLDPSEVVLVLKYHFGIELPSSFNNHFVEASISTGVLGFLGAIDGGQVVLTIQGLNMYEKTVQVKLENICWFNQFWTAMQITTQHSKSPKYKVTLQKVLLAERTHQKT